MKNTLPVSAQVRRPRGLIKLNGTVMTGVVSFEITNNTFFQADTFRATFAASGLPAGFGPSWWSTEPQILIDIFAGFPTDPNSYSAADLDLLFSGQVDDLDYSPSRKKITVTGRDLTAKFIDKKTDAKYPNLTASQIATKLAQNAGMKPVVTATSTRVGRYYQIDNVRLQDNRTEWDLLSFLAREEGFIVYAKGQELHFEPAPDPGADPYVFEWIPPAADGGPPQGNFTSLSLSRSLTLAKDVTVIVRSWNSRHKKVFSKTARATHGKKPPETQIYTYDIPGLTPDQAQQRATKLLAELTKHERKATLEGPADNMLQRTDIVQLKGTGTDWDQVYFIDSLTRSLDRDEGYSWSVEVKNHSPESTVTV